MERPVRVLVVDDDADIRESLALMLRALGYEVELASNGLEALRMIRSGVQPSIVLLDLVMPVMNGWRFAAKLAASPELASIPVIVVSAVESYWGTPEGVRGRISKPFEMQALVDVIEKWAA